MARRTGYYAVRNERAKAAGYASYWEQRQARRLNYNTPIEYRRARGGERPLPPPAPAPRPVGPIETARLGPGGGPGRPARIGYHVDERSSAAAQAILDAIDAAPDTARVRIYEGGAQIGGKGGFSAQYLTELYETFDDPDDLYDWIDQIGGDYSEYAGGAGLSITIS